MEHWREHKPAWKAALAGSSGSCATDGRQQHGHNSPPLSANQPRITCCVLPGVMLRGVHFITAQNRVFKACREAERALCRQGATRATVPPAQLPQARLLPPRFRATRAGQKLVGGAARAPGLQPCRGRREGARQAGGGAFTEQAIRVDRLLGCSSTWRSGRVCGRDLLAPFLG